MKNILVFPCGSEIGLELYRSLCFSTHFNLYGGSSTDDHGMYVYENYIGSMPFITDSDFIEKLNEVVEKYKIDFIFPAHDSVVLSLAQAKDKKQLKCDVLASPVATCEIARSKIKTYEVLERVLPVPKLYDKDNLSQATLPVFIKPDVGQGSKGTHKAYSQEEVNFYTNQDPSAMVLEYLPGAEYTVDCFTDRNGQLRFVKPRERARVANGISVNSFAVDDDRFLPLAHKLNEAIVFNGVWFFQVKEDVEGELVLMEIAPRVAGTMGLERVRGVNLPLLTIFNALNYEVDIIENDYQVAIDRALENSFKHNIKYNHVYIDLDDLIIFRGEVNTQILAFIFQCRNKGVKIHLVSRHKEVLTQTLEKFRIGQLFDSIELIKDDTPKSKYINEKDAIFIDDSFTERKEVANTLGIPVFDSHMIEGLMI